MKCVNKKSLLAMFQIRIVDEMCNDVLLLYISYLSTQGAMGDELCDDWKARLPTNHPVRKMAGIVVFLAEYG
jgi:hypothetical protein